MAHRHRIRWVLLVAALLLPVGRLSGDLLITNTDAKWVGDVIDKGDIYLVVLPTGDRLTFPKTLVREVLSGEELAAWLEKQLRDVDLANDDISKLVDLTEKLRLPERKKKLLADAYALRLAATPEKDPRALRALAAWCQKYGLTDQARDCRLQLTELEVSAELDEAKGDADALERLAHTYRMRGMADEAAQCLSSVYQLRKQQSRTPEAQWKLAQWCRNQSLDQQRDEMHRLAIRTAAANKGLALLMSFLDRLTHGSGAPETLRACAAEIYALRLTSAGRDPMTLAQLATWCEEHGLADQAKQTESAALEIAPDDRRVRMELGYVRLPPDGAWRKVPWWITAVRTSRVVPLGQDRLMLGGRKEGDGFLYVAVHFKQRAGKEDLSRFTIVDKRSALRADLFSWRAGEEALLIFKGRWPSLDGLYLQGLSQRLPLPPTDEDGPQSDNDGPAEAR